MYRIIINADDCGQSVNTNKKLKSSFKWAKLLLVRSWQIEMNGGAIRLYKRYSDIVSFGAGEVKTWQL